MNATLCTCVLVEGALGPLLPTVIYSLMCVSERCPVWQLQRQCASVSCHRKDKVGSESYDGTTIKVDIFITEIIVNSNSSILCWEM